MAAFELLEHTADIGFRVEAADLRELFEAAAQALVSVAMDNRRVTAAKSVVISANGDSRESLLVNWLNEVVYVLDGERMAITRCKVQELTGTHLRGAALGEPRDPERHPARMVVKGVTYHQLRIEQSERGWFCEVYLDV